MVAAAFIAARRKRVKAAVLEMVGATLAAGLYRVGMARASQFAGTGPRLILPGAGVLTVPLLV